MVVVKVGVLSISPRKFIGFADYRIRDITFEIGQFLDLQLRRVVIPRVLLISQLLRPSLLLYPVRDANNHG